MHLCFHVEDQSGRFLLEKLLPPIVSIRRDITYNIHHYRGLGSLPNNLRTDGQVPRLLLANLPKFLTGYSRTPGIDAVIVVADLDSEQRQVFLAKLRDIAVRCGAQHIAHFCLAVEEIEAWLLGDLEAVLAAYPHAKRAVLDKYQQDSVCGTWELLGDAVHPGGIKALKKLPYPEVGRLKCEWASRIGEHMDVTANRSPSFQTFRAKIAQLMEPATP